MKFEREECRKYKACPNAEKRWCPGKHCFQIKPEANAAAPVASTETAGSDAEKTCRLLSWGHNGEGGVLVRMHLPDGKPVKVELLKKDVQRMSQYPDLHDKGLI